MQTSLGQLFLSRVDPDLSRAKHHYQAAKHLYVQNFGKEHPRQCNAIMGLARVCLKENKRILASSMVHQCVNIMGLAKIPADLKPLTKLPDDLDQAMMPGGLDGECSLEDWHNRVAVADYAREVARYTDAATVLAACIGIGEDGTDLPPDLALLRGGPPTGLPKDDLALACIKLQECYVRYQVPAPARWNPPGTFRRASASTPRTAGHKAAGLDAALALLARAQELCEEGCADFTGSLAGQIAQGRGLAYFLCGSGPGDDALAKENWTAAFATRKEAGDLPGLGETLNSLGMMEMKAKQWEAAEKYLMECLRVREQALDATHPDLAQVGGACWTARGADRGAARWQWDGMRWHLVCLRVRLCAC